MKLLSEWNIFVYSVMFTVKTEAVCKNSKLGCGGIQQLSKMTEGGDNNVSLDFITERVG